MFLFTLEENKDKDVLHDEVIVKKKSECSEGKPEKPQKCPLSESPSEGVFFL